MEKIIRKGKKTEEKKGGKELWRLFVSLMFHSFLFSVQGLKKDAWENFSYVVIWLILSSVHSSTLSLFFLLFLDSFLYFLFSINRLLFLLYAFFAQLLPLSLLLLYLFFLYFLSRSVRRHSSENAGCSFSMYEVFSITLKPVKSVSQMMLKLKQTNPFLLQPSDFF